MRTLIFGVCLVLALLCPLSRAAADEKHDKAIGAALRWLAESQRRDGSWENETGKFPVATTAMAGLALLMDGGSPTQGDHRESLAKAVQWLRNQVGKDGRFDAGNPQEARALMFSHAYATLFLACAYEREGQDVPRQAREDEIARKWTRRDLAAALAKAVAFIGSAQTARGGWNDTGVPNEFDELGPSAAVVQALLAVRQAGLEVPDTVLGAGKEYLRKCDLKRHPQTQEPDREQPASLVARLVVSLSAGDHEAAHVRGWLPYCPRSLPAGKVESDLIRSYEHFYLAQFRYALGEEGHARIDPKAKENDRLLWSKYHDELADHLLGKQPADGRLGQTFPTAVALVVLQLDREKVGYFRRLRGKAD